MTVWRETTGRLDFPRVSWETWTVTMFGIQCGRDMGRFWYDEENDRPCDVHYFCIGLGRGGLYFYWTKPKPPHPLDA